MKMTATGWHRLISIKLTCLALFVLTITTLPFAFGCEARERRVSPAARITAARNVIAESAKSCRQVIVLQNHIQNISEHVKNYGYGKHIEDDKNMPIYVTHAALSSLSLSILSKWLEFDPTYTIAAINLLIWKGWKMAHEYEEKDEDLLLLSFMSHNFLLHRDSSESKTMYFRPRQVLLRGFSHIDEAHLGANMACLLATGPLVQKYTVWSNFAFTSFYVCALYASSLFNEVVYVPLMKRYGPKSNQSFFKRFQPERSVSLGASGAVSAVITFCGLICPHEEIEIESDQRNGGPDTEPMPMWIIALSGFLTDIILPLTKKGKQSNIGYGAHIGGSVFGATVYVINRLWSAKLHTFARRLTSIVKKLLPVRICTTVAALVSKICRYMYARVCAVPWMEMLCIGMWIYILVIGADEEEELVHQD